MPFEVSTIRALNEVPELPFLSAMWGWPAAYWNDNTATRELRRIFGGGLAVMFPLDPEMLLFNSDTKANGTKSQAFLAWAKTTRGRLVSAASSGAMTNEVYLTLRPWHLTQGKSAGPVAVGQAGYEAALQSIQVELSLAAAAISTVRGACPQAKVIVCLDTEIETWKRSDLVSSLTTADARATHDGWLAQYSDMIHLACRAAGAAEVYDYEMYGIRRKKSTWEPTAYKPILYRATTPGVFGAPCVYHADDDSETDERLLSRSSYFRYPVPKECGVWLSLTNRYDWASGKFIPDASLSEEQAELYGNAVATAFDNDIQRILWWPAREAELEQWARLLPAFVKGFMGGGVRHHCIKPM